MQIDWFSLLIVTATTLVAAVFIMVIIALAARMLDLIDPACVLAYLHGVNRLTAGAKKIRLLRGS